MDPGLIVGIVLTCVVITAGILLNVFGVLKLRKDALKWRPLVGQFPFEYNWTGGNSLPFEETVLVQKVNFAADCIVQKGPWEKNKVLWALAGISIIIIPDNLWQDRAGNTVSGQSVPDLNGIQVGVGLRAMCHEFMHICEAKLDGPIDYDHANWDKRGMNDAENLYLKSLTS